jgi:hypothetical protein
MMYRIDHIDVVIRTGCTLKDVEDKLNKRVDPNGTYVYVLRFDDGVFKIGRSGNIPLRMYDLTRHLQEGFKIVDIVSTDRHCSLERYIHDQIRSMGVCRDERGDEYYNCETSVISDVMDMIERVHDTIPVDMTTEKRDIRCDKTSKSLAMHQVMITIREDQFTRIKEREDINFSGWVRRHMDNSEEFGSQ